MDQSDRQSDDTRSPQQGTLFAPDVPPWELDDAGQRMVASVVFPSVADRQFDYLVPDGLVGAVEAGQRVLAPLGRGDRPREGYCVWVGAREVNRSLKHLAKVVDARSLLSASMLELSRWLADYYLCGLGQVLEAILPAGVRGQAGTRKRLEVTTSVDADKPIEDLGLTEKQGRALDAVRRHDGPIAMSDLLREAGCSQGPVDALRRKGLLEVHSARVRTEAASGIASAGRQADLTLEEDQRRALAAILDAINAKDHETLLLYGVTGSGKTEVYIQAIQEVVRGGRQAIVLVPEISLTPQTCQRFRERFQTVAVLHSHLSDAQRHYYWQEISEGNVQVVVGARSAVFAPTPHLGLIVIDEEHESSFKQETVPRYHARTIAEQRARMANVPLVLGSATPSLESWRQAESGAYRLLELPRRVFDRPLPRVKTIDLRHESGRAGYRGAISRPLELAMREALEEGGQVILLLNRRGFATHVQCPSCGQVVRCPDCDIALTHHHQGDYLLCHYCDFQRPAPDECPECESTGIRYSGRGTEKLEHEVQRRFPGYPCKRMDTDAMRRPGSHEAALAAFRDGEVRILLGTQMIAKGLDFPNVTLVGVVNADVALHLPDFRAGERTFQLLAQVAGRTGRGPKGGHVLVQTFSPDHPSIRCAARHDYRAFATAALGVRRGLGYPPFSSMVRIVIRGTDEVQTAAVAEEFGDRLTETFVRMNATVRMLGPAPAPIARLRGKHRLQLQLQSENAVALREAVVAVTNSIKAPENIEWMADVDPISML